MTNTNVPPKVQVSEALFRDTTVGRPLVPWLLILSDLAVLALVFVAVRWTHLSAPLMYYTWGEGSTQAEPLGADWFFIVAAACVVYFLLLGQYGQRRQIWDDARVISSTLMIAAVVDGVMLLSIGHPGMPWPWLLSWLVLLVALPLSRMGMKLLLRQLGLWQLPCVIIGDGETAQAMYRLLHDERLLGFDVRAFVRLKDGGKEEPHIVEDGTMMLDATHTVPVLVLRSDALLTLRELGMPHVIVALEEDELERSRHTVERLAVHPNAIDVVLPLSGLPLFGSDVNYMFGQDVFLLRVRNNLMRRQYRVVKRVIDVVGSVVLLVLLAPLFAVVSWRIRAEDGGKAFFAQERVGRAHTTFQCLKFRTMHADAERVLEAWKNNNPEMWESYVANNFKIKDDPRVTKTGTWLRRTSLDELPQLINVLRGEMSLVGPRPLLEREIPDYGDPIRQYRRVPPGITGLWQVSGRSNTTFADRAFYDTWYIKNWSLWYDVVILIRTIGVVLGRSGAY